jgi:hypothetical protein
MPSLHPSSVIINMESLVCKSYHIVQLSAKCKIIGCTNEQCSLSQVLQTKQAVRCRAGYEVEKLNYLKISHIKYWSMPRQTLSF